MPLELPFPTPTTVMFPYTEVMVPPLPIETPLPWVVPEAAPVPLTSIRPAVAPIPVDETTAERLITTPSPTAAVPPPLPVMTILPLAELTFVPVPVTYTP